MLNRRNILKYSIGCLTSLIMPSTLLAKTTDNISDFERQLQKTLINKFAVEHNKIKNDYECNECYIDLGVFNFKDDESTFYNEVDIICYYKNNKKTKEEWEKYYKYMGWLCRSKPTEIDNIPICCGGTWQVDESSFKQITGSNISWETKYTTRFNIDKNRLINNIKKELLNKYNIPSTVEIFNDTYTCKYHYNKRKKNIYNKTS
jgi:hypothetical protein